MFDSHLPLYLPLYWRQHHNILSNILFSQILYQEPKRKLPTLKMSLINVVILLVIFCQVSKYGCSLVVDKGKKHTCVSK